MTPRTRRRVALGVLASLALLAMAADLIASDLPLLMKKGGKTYFLPCLTRPAELAQLSGGALEATLGPDDWALWTPLRHGPTRSSRPGGQLARLEPPSARHWLGTDDAGRDVAARLLHGTRVSLLMGLGAALVAGLLGLLLGVAAAASRGTLDFALARTTEVMIALPALLLLIAVRGLSDDPASLGALAVLIGVLRVPHVARPVRSEARRIAASDYVLAARGLGAGPLRIALHHVLPGAARPALIAAAITFAHAVLLETTLTFLGAGVAAPAPSWGALLLQAHHHLSPWLILAPAAMLVLVVAAALALAETLQPDRS